MEVEPLIWDIAKLFFLFAYLVYIVFAVVAVRQVYLMTQTIQVGFEFVLKTIAWFHLFISIAVLLYAFVTL